jgi:hypothetical protein
MGGNERLKTTSEKDTAFGKGIAFFRGAYFEKEAPSK